MLRFIRRLLAGAAAGIAVQPASLAAPPTEPVVDTEQSSEARHIAEHPMQAMGVRAEYLRDYSGAKTMLTDDLVARVRASKRFRNPAVDLAGARQEFEKFVEERTR